MANQPTSFQKLPAEMLGYIFEECIEEDNIKSRGGDLGVSPWLLAQVCRFWYQTAKGTPSLWRKLLITDRTRTYWSLKRNESQYPSKNTHTRLHSSMQVCVNGPEVASALKRSGAASLELTLAFGGTLNASNSQLDSAFYQELYDMVFNEYVASRISHLVIDSEYRDSLDWLFWPGEQLESISLPSISLPTLISLQIHSLKPLLANVDNCSSMLKSILESATKLRDFEVSMENIPADFKYTTWNSSSYGAVIRNLKQIKVVHADILDEMLGSSAGIEDLVIDQATKSAEVDEELFWGIETIPWPTVNTPPILFDRLIKLHLISDDFSLLDRLNFPFLDELRLTQSCSYARMRNHVNGVASPPSRPDFVLQLPALRTLRVSSPNITPLNRFDMPHLKTLHLTCTRIAQGKADADFAAFVSGSSSSSGATAISTSFLDGVQDLYINAVMSEKGSISTLKAFPSLRTFYLVPGKKMGKSLVQELSMSKHKRDTGGVLCPELTTIEIDCYSFRQFDKKDRRNKRVGTAMTEGLPSAVQKLVASRKKWGEQLERCILTATDGSKRDYVEG